MNKETETDHYDGANEIERAWRDGLTPDPLLSVSEWSDQHRMLSSKASAEPGRWRTSRTPYLKEIMDCLSPNSPVERVVFMKAAQLGATEMGSNWIGYVIHHAPGPMMAVWPTVDMAKRNSKQRIDPLIEESAALRELISPARSRDSGNTILAKEFRGGVLVMTGANSAVGLRSMPVRYLFLDEVDGYPLDVEGEGDAISLAEARTRTFTRRKIFIVSTPTISGVSAIEREYEASDQRRYFVPCPHCDHRQWLRFEQLRWEKAKPETAAYVCESCEQPIAEHHKTRMLELGQWRSMIAQEGATAAKGRKKTAGFHLSSLYSPVGWRSWRDVAAAWESAVSKESGSAAAIKTFKNTELGETWLEEGEAPDWQRLIERREDYRIGSVALGGLLLVGGADVQKDRIEVSIWAFGRGKESWLVEHRVLMGDTARDAVWRRLAELLAERWTHASGVLMPLTRLALDTGFATQETYAFARSCHDPRLMPVKGMRSGAMGGAALIGTPTAVDVTQGGRKLRRGIKLYSVAVGMAKMELYNNLRKAADVGSDGSTPLYPAGFVHLPKVDAEYVQQLCAESLITRHDRNGFAHREWQKMRERNEALDCFDSQTEVLTYTGWKRFADLSHGDTLATVNLNTDSIEYQSPQNLVSRHYKGPMLTVCGTRLNFSVTPNHRMVTYKKVFDRSVGKWRFDVPPEITLAKDLTIHHTIKILANWQGNKTIAVTIPASVKQRSTNVIHPQCRVCAKTFAEFLGWYVAEGSCRIAVAGSSVLRAVLIAQTKPGGRARITELLERLPWLWHWTDTFATISCKQLYDYIQRECAGLCHEKRVPQWIKDADRDVIAAFLDGAVGGDGWIQNGYRSYATTSKLLADDIAELFFKLGGSPSVTIRLTNGWWIRGRSGEVTLPQYHVRENNGRKSAALDGKSRKFMVKERDYCGMVYCATVPNGTLVVRRAGKMMVAGNCYVYARAAASSVGLDRFEERHWRELEKQLGLSLPDVVPAQVMPVPMTMPQKVGDASQNHDVPAGIAAYGSPIFSRRVIRSPWLKR